MMRCLIFSVSFCLCLMSGFAAYGEEEDIFADYSKEIRKSADAKATNVYDAWGNNMANLIEHGHRDGIVVDGEGEYADGKVRSDGVGNITVDKNANIGHIINKTEIKNSTVIIKKNQPRTNW